MLPQISDKSSLIYTAFYCEENVYHLCKTISEILDKNNDHYEVYACFISNKTRSVPIKRQQAAKSPDGFVIWDYHVILLLKENDETLNKKRSWIYDFDTTLSFPCDFETYARESLPLVDLPEYHRKYRIVSSETFLRMFASDRSHMSSNNGTTISPPNYPPIFTAETKMNLPSFISMTENLDSVEFGKVLNEKEFFKFCDFTH
ncbi:N-terminal glutamine amidase-domain-containing protein [Gigaspora rosea]|uniref:Protein N-terminal glutamine amidohydrolase n=1 Tax=Gigaspora rosea TaxID=44941 RepID=A0A397VSP5_9GLOM|nr:N-terminal glutamine amidase-domain-containing protein [Gigaspora rosea]